MITIYGQHACKHAIQNPKRYIKKIFLLKGANPDFDIPKNIQIETVDRQFFIKLSAEGNTQNIAALVEPLTSAFIEDLENLEEATVLVLDQLTDPRNIGAIFRNAAAFGVTAIIMQDRHGPKENAILVKTASGGFDMVQHVYVKNISQALASLKKSGYWAYGLAEGSNQKLSNIKWPPKRIIVMGAEGSGMRDLVKKNCDEIVTITTNANFSTLNVVNASAIVLHNAYEN